MAQLPSAFAVHSSRRRALYVEAEGLGGEVDDGGGPAPGRGGRARLEVVRRDGPAERQLHVGVARRRRRGSRTSLPVASITSAPFSADTARSEPGWRTPTIDLAVDQDLGRDRLPSSGDDRPVLDERRHVCLPSGAVPLFGRSGVLDRLPLSGDGDAFVDLSPR